MSNFLHKPCNPDGENAIDIVNSIKHRSKLKKNYLESILTKRLDTKQFIPIELNEVSDFPKLKKRIIKQKLLFGSFQYKSSLSYVTDMIKNSKAYFIQGNQIKNYEIAKQNFLEDVKNLNAKIIAFEITSRHKRSKKKSKIEFDLQYNL